MGTVEMSKLDEMKKIAAARTKGEWILSGNDNVDNKFGTEKKIERLFTSDGGYQSGDGNNQKNDSAFVAMAANMFDKLMAVAEAAKALGPAAWDLSLKNALKELDQE